MTSIPGSSQGTAFRNTWPYACLSVGAGIAIPDRRRRRMYSSVGCQMCWASPSPAGFRTSLSTDEFKRQLKEIGVVLTGQSADLAPADGRLYALRDVTGTINSIPLIASSVMSKKIASGAQAIVLDVKAGVGAFMPTVAEATKLARLMVSIGGHVGRQVVALISDMNQPLGYAVGNALEVREAIETLQNGGPRDFREHCLEVAGHLLLLAGSARTRPAARAQLEAALSGGSALAKLKQLVAAQGGDMTVVDVASRSSTRAISPVRATT